MSKLEKMVETFNEECRPGAPSIYHGLLAVFEKHGKEMVAEAYTEGESDRDYGDGQAYATRIIEELKGK